MKLTKCKLGELIELCDEKNINEIYTVDYVKGISTQKYFIETKADMNGVSLKSYKVVRPGYFAYVPDTSRRGDKISIAYNNTDDVILVSSISNVFKVKSQHLLSDYLFMFFNRAEFDRYSRYNSFGSAREPFNWEDMCDIDFELPDINIQEKYVKIYLSMIKNQKNYESGLEDLKLTCDGFIEKMRIESESFSLDKYLTRRTEKNNDFLVSKLIGVGKDGFIEPKQSKDETNGHICYLVKKNDFVFAPPQIHEGSIDYYEGNDTIKCSDAYIVFYINNLKVLNPHYLLMILKNPNIQHIMWFSRDGVREQFNFEQLIELKIPVPPIEMQDSIANIYKSYIVRKELANKIKEQIKNICPILIAGAIKEAKEV